MEVHHHSIPETAVVDARIVVEIRTLQVEKTEADTRIVSSGEVGIRASAGTGSAVVVVAAPGVDTGYAEAEVAGENILFAAAENTRSVGVGWKSRKASWGNCPTSLALHRDRERVSAEVVEAAECTVVTVAVDVELVETVLPHIGLAFARGLTSCTGFERVVVVVVEVKWL